MPASARLSRKRSRLAGSWFVGRQVRGLWVKTWTDSAPIVSARSIALWTPAEDETCAPICIGSDASTSGRKFGVLSGGWIVLGQDREPLDRRQHVQLLPLEEQLPRERRAVQLPQGQDALCHGVLRNSTEPPV